jgi:hypothetical protein
MGEPLEFQVGLYIDSKRFNTARSQEQARVRAMKHFLKTGEEIPGVKIVARWRNPENKNPAHANWKTTNDAGQSIGDFYKTLHGSRGALRGLAAKYGVEEDEEGDYEGGDDED